MITLIDFRKNLKLRIKGVINIIAISLFLVLGLSLLQPFLYKSSFSVLIVQDAKDANDVYTAIKSADKLGSLLQKIVKTTDFFDAVMESKTYKVSKDDFSVIEKTKRKQWDKMIDANLVQETGILEFDIYYKDKEGAEEYANAIAETLINRSSKFYGASNIIDIRTINAPLTSDNVEKPMIFINILLGLLFGIFSSMLYIYFTIVIKDEETDSIPVDSVPAVEPIVVEPIVESNVNFEEQNFTIVEENVQVAEDNINYDEQNIDKNR